MDRFDQGWKDMKELVLERKVETSAVEKDLKEHREGDGHPLLVARVATLEAALAVAQAAARQRPIQIWQVVTAAFFILLGVMSDIISIISLIHSLAH